MLTEDGTTAFHKVLAIFALSEKQQNGVYDCRHRRMVKNVIDTFFICAEMTKVQKTGENFHFHFLPYPVYKLKVTRGNTRKLYLTTIPIDDIYRPACFIESVCSGGDHISARYFGFDLLFCDRSLWKTQHNDEAPPPFAANNPEDTTGFVLDTEQQLDTYNTIVTHQGNNVATSSSEDETSDEDDGEEED